MKLITAQRKIQSANYYEPNSKKSKKILNFPFNKKILKSVFFKGTKKL